MKTIKITKWKAKLPDGKEVEDSTLTMLSVLISNKKPEDMPKGLDNFRLFRRLAIAFEAAEKTGELTLEEADYNFIKKTIEYDIPSTWAMNPNINSAIEAFLNA